jgi:hypothetical protein
MGQRAVFLEIGVLLSLCPDLDYIVLWFVGYGIEPRYTHSLFFCLCVSFISLIATPLIFRDFRYKIPLRLYFAATFSHLALDLIVAVHPMPLFWPVIDKLVVLPHGVLPSAGQLNLANYYLWRNLIIELGILVPVSCIIAPATQRIINSGVIIKISVFFLFISFLVWGYCLKR